MNKFFSRKKLVFGLLCAFIISIASCASAGRLEAPPMEPQRSAWVVYWDWQRGVDEAKVAKPDVLVAFAASFDEAGALRLPKELTAERLAALPAENVFLSFVNDQQQGDKTLMKDTAVLKKMLGKKQARSKHIAEIIALCQRYHFCGIEIDYENIWRDKSLMKNFSSFVKELKAEAEQNNLKLRVVLEPKTLRYAQDLPKDVEYVVMFYNLYGGHSEPGPKADRRFIWHTLSAVAKLPGTPNVAFATGGFDWTAPRKAKSLTQIQAEALMKKYKVNPERDDASRALHFEYDDGKVKHTVWYADGETLKYWQGLAEAVGFKRISIWRLGGNEQVK